MFLQKKAIGFRGRCRETNRFLKEHLDILTIFLHKRTNRISVRVNVLTYCRRDLDIINSVQCVLVAMVVLVVEEIPSHQSSLLHVGGVAQRPDHIVLSLHPHEESQNQSEAQRIHVCMSCNDVSEQMKRERGRCPADCGVFIQHLKLESRAKLNTTATPPDSCVTRRLHQEYGQRKCKQNPEMRGLYVQSHQTDSVV